MELSTEEKKMLLLAARESIKTHFSKDNTPSAEYNNYPNLKIKAGAFVTLKINNELRGCIGFITSDQPLFETICEAAKHAAFHDLRFPPLAEQELNSVTIEISILSPLKKITDYDEIKIGEHGLLVEEGQYRGLLLPQVAVEHNFSLEQFLSSVCMKAGLAHDYWQKKKIDLKVFTAVIFQEERRN